MVYYQILKQRRKDLKISIQDISSQTRLAPQYISAIEENDLDIFTGDFDFVRRFVQAYAETIGVNWEYIKDDVELNISRYVQAKAQAPMEQVVLTPAPEMYEAEETPAFKESPKKKKQASKKKGKKGKKAGKKVDIQKNAKQVVKWTKASRRRFLFAIAAGIAILLFAVNMVLNKISDEQYAAQESARQAELKAKEEETKKLADQKKETRKKTAAEEAEKNKLESNVTSESVLSCSDSENNIYTITNLIETDQRLTFEISMPKDSTIAIYQDDTPINDGDVKQTSAYSETFTIDHTCLIQLEIEDFQDNDIFVNGEKITFDKALWYEGEPAILYFEVKTNDSVYYDDVEDEEVYYEEEEEEE